MSNKANDKVKELINWCVDNNDKNGFCVFIRMSGHVNQVSFSVHLDGWSETKDSSLYESVYLDREDSVGRVDRITRKIKHLKDEYDKTNSPEERKIRADIDKAAEIEALKAKLAELESN